jgi:two-component system OmpR family sensor kinase/two-component system sensor histidine kinase BaeS
MKPLWIQLSLRITGLLLAVIVLTFVVAVVFTSIGGEGPPGAPPTPVEFSLRLATLLATVGVVGIGVGVQVSRTMSAPITRLAEAAQRIGAGELQTRISVGGSRELVELAQAFNTMAGNLQRAEGLRANLMADVAHELRTPLTALEGNLRAALDRVYALDEAEIANLYSQTHHLIRLVNDLRELALADARQLPLEKQPIDLAALVNETLLVFAPLAEEQGVRLDRQIEQLPMAHVDAARIRQVLHNLLANALRYTPRGGIVTVVGRREADAICLAVQDTGAGLEAEQLEWVFERFYRGDKSRSRDTGGTGLGLAIVKAIVEAHDGRMAVQSDGIGRGSTFSLYLPRS